MKTYKSLFIIGALALASTGFTSCSDDEEYDFPGTTDNYVFQFDRSSSFRIIQTPTMALCDFSMEIPVQCSNKAASDIKVTFGIDNSLIDAYNAEHNTNYVALPDGIVVFENDAVVIPQGKYKAEESIKLTTTEDQDALLALSEANEYLVPIVRKEVEGVNALPSQDVNPVNYIEISVIKDNVHHGAGQGDIKGARVADQSGWSVEMLDGSYCSGDPLCLFDKTETSIATFIGDSANGLNMVIDMGKSYTFDALTLYYAQQFWWMMNYYGQLTTTMEISTSEDGQTWHSVGAMQNGDSDTFMVFYAPITARYVKIHIPDQNTGVSSRFTAGIFNIYAL